MRLFRLAGVALAFLLLGSSWPLLSARLRPVLPLYESRILPDFAPVPEPLGFPCTGLTLAPDGSLWAGVGLTEPSVTAGVVHLSRDMTKVLRVITLRDLGLPAGSVQGVAAGRDRLWFVLKRRPEAKLVEIDRAGRLLRSADFRRQGANGVAFDSRRDALVIVYDDGLLQWIDAQSLRPTGMTFTTQRTMPDHLAYLPDDDRLLLTWGRNREDGRISMYSLTDFQPITTWSMQGADAIEGIAVDGDTIMLMNDAGTHEGLPRVNRGLEYRLPPV